MKLLVYTHVSFWCLLLCVALNAICYDSGIIKGLKCRSQSSQPGSGVFSAIAEMHCMSCELYGYELYYTDWNEWLRKADRVSLFIPLPRWKNLYTLYLNVSFILIVNYSNVTASIHLDRDYSSA